MLSRTLLCLAVVSASTPLLADTVWLKNGDKLSGKITVFDGGKLLIQTQYAGAVPIDWKEVKTLESDQQLLVKQDAYTGEKAKALHAAEDGKVTLANGETPKTVELASIQQILKPKPVVEDLVWKGNVDMALDYRRAEKIRMIMTSASRLPRVMVDGVIRRKVSTTASSRMTSSPLTTGVPSILSTDSSPRSGSGKGV